LSEKCSFISDIGSQDNLASRRSAVGLAGVAPRLVPSRGHAALLFDTLIERIIISIADEGSFALPSVMAPLDPQHAPLAQPAEQCSAFDNGCPSGAG
jgi:hypothetical protein